MHMITQHSSSRFCDPYSLAIWLSYNNGIFIPRNTGGDTQKSNLCFVDIWVSINQCLYICNIQSYICRTCFSILQPILWLLQSTQDTYIYTHCTVECYFMFRNILRQCWELSSARAASRDLVICCKLVGSVCRWCSEGAPGNQQITRHEETCSHSHTHYSKKFTFCQGGL